MPKELVHYFDSGDEETGFLIAASFLIIGMFIDAIPAIIILGIILLLLVENVGMHALHFAMIGVVSLAFRLVTTPYGLCLLISCTLGKIKIVEALKDVVIIILPKLILLVLVIVFPEIVLFVPRLIKRSSSSAICDLLHFA